MTVEMGRSYSDSTRAKRSARERPEVSVHFGKNQIGNMSTNVFEAILLIAVS